MEITKKFEGIELEEGVLSEEAIKDHIRKKEDTLIGFIDELCGNVFSDGLANKLITELKEKIESCEEKIEEATDEVEKGKLQGVLASLKDNLMNTELNIRERLRNAEMFPEYKAYFEEMILGFKSLLK